MYRRVTIAGLAVVALIAVMVWLAGGDGSTAVAQPGGQAQKPAAPPPAATTQLAQQAQAVGTQPATQPAQGKLVVQTGGSAVSPKPTPEELKALARAAEEWVKNNPKGKTVASEKPVVQQNQERGMPTEEREAIGLPAPTWVAKHGKVQPAVRDALEEQRRKINRREPMLEFQSDRPCGFQGMAYVDIYLRYDVKGKPESGENQAAVKEAQDRILRSLTAGEFSTFFVFKNTAGLVGYVDQTGLNKLLEDSSVVAIGLDDQQRPEDPPMAMHDETTENAFERIGKVYAEVYESLDKSKDGYVLVMVSLNRPLKPELPLNEEDLIRDRMQDRIVSSVTAEEFKMRGRGAVLAGFANGAGLAKLDRHPDLRGLFLNVRGWPVR